MFVLACTACAATPTAHKPTGTDESTPSVTTIRRKAWAAYFAKDWAGCGALFAQSQRAYTAARCYSQAGMVDAAFGALRQAIDDSLHGEDPTDDSKLEPLHADPRWAPEMARLQTKRTEWSKRENPELVALYTQDQADRAAGPNGAIDWPTVQVHDRERRQRVDQLLTSHGAHTADDYFHAAMVYQHGETPADIQRAHDLALEASKLDPAHDLALWLAAASEDRVLMYEHQAQKWGTQYKKVDDAWIVWPVDPAITDDQRLDRGVPPLAISQQRAAELNAPRK